MEALQKSGNLPCILNAANEIAVAAFLKDQIGFLEMSDLIEECMSAIKFIEHPTLEDYIHTDHETRIKAKEWIEKVNCYPLIVIRKTIL